MDKIQRAINQIEAMRDLASELAKDHPETGAWKNQTLAFDAALIVLRRFLDNDGRELNDEETNSD